MTRFVVDASIAVKWFFEEVHSPLARLLLSPDLDLIAPEFMVSEVANTLVTRMKSTGLTLDESYAVLERLPTLVRFREWVSLAPAALLLAQQYGRTAYDSLYVALAERESCQFVTADVRLFNAVATAMPQTALRIEDIPTAIG